MSKSFQFTHYDLSPSQFRLERIFEMIPGLFSWTILISVTTLSFFNPLYAAIVIIAYDIYWLLRLFYMTVFLVLAYGVLAVERGTDWNQRCRFLEEGTRALPVLEKKLGDFRKQKKIREWLACKNEQRELKAVLKNKVNIPSFDSLYHVVLIAVYKEGYEIVEPGIKEMSHSQFPAKRIVPVLAVEERAGADQYEMALELQRKYRHYFYNFLVALHPDGVPGETKVKGANVTFAAKQAAELFEREKISLDQVIVSCFDADTVPGREYFSALTYHYMRHPNRDRASYQPIPVYHNNIWEAPGFARVLEMGSSFFQLVEATNPEKLVTFSSHSMSFKALVEVGYWPVDMISDDSAIFWKALIHYDGDYRVVPIYVTLSMDVPMAGSFWKTLVTIFQQKLRWAWGVENFPIVIRGFLQSKRINLISKLRYLGKLLEMHVSWATVGFLITFIGWLPAIFATREFSDTVLYYNSARITSLIFNLALAALAVTIILSLLLLPKKKTPNPLRKRVLFALEWLFVPLVFTFLSTLPALVAQTRLMFGYAMEFQVTEKKRA